MVMLGAVLVVAVVAGGIGLAIRRRATTEANSVEGYRSTLSTLRDIGSRSEQSGLRVDERRVGVEPGGSGAGVTGDDQEDGTERPIGYGRQISDPRSGLVFDDPGASRAFERNRRGPLGTAPGGVQLSPRGQHRALSAMNHGPRRVAGPILVVLTVLALGAVVAELGLHSRHPKPAAVSDRSHTSHTSGTSHTSTGGNATRSHSSGAGRRSRRKTTPTTTSTIPTAFTAGNVTANGATYAVPAGTYTLSLATTNGPCWIMVTNSAGTTVFTETMPPNSQHRLSASGALQVDLGAPSVIDAEVDSRALVLPNGYRSPFTMTVQPAAS